MSDPLLVTAGLDMVSVGACRSPLTHNSDMYPLRMSRTRTESWVRSGLSDDS